MNSKSKEKEMKADLVSSGVFFKVTVSEKKEYHCESGITVFAWRVTYSSFNKIKFAPPPQIPLLRLSDLFLENTTLSSLL